MNRQRVRRVVSWSVSLMALAAIASSDARPDGNANAFYGRKMMSETDWAPVEDQEAFGAEVTLGRAEWPAHFAVDLLQSSDTWDESGFHLKALTRELDLGVRTNWSVGRTHPYIGGGLAVIYAKLDASLLGTGLHESDMVAGAWVGGGVFWRIGRALNLGANVRYSRGQVNLFDVNGQGGGTVVGLLVGWGWPAARQVPRAPKAG